MTAAVCGWPSQRDRCLDHGIALHRQRMGAVTQRDQREWRQHQLVRPIAHAARRVRAIDDSERAIGHPLPGPQAARIKQERHAVHHFSRWPRIGPLRGGMPRPGDSGKPGNAREIIAIKSGHTIANRREIADLGK